MDHLYTFYVRTGRKHSHPAATQCPGTYSRVSFARGQRRPGRQSDSCHRSGSGRTIPPLILAQASQKDGPHCDRRWISRLEVGTPHFYRAPGGQILPTHTNPVLTPESSKCGSPRSDMATNRRQGRLWRQMTRWSSRLSGLTLTRPECRE